MAEELSFMDRLKSLQMEEEDETIAPAQEAVPEGFVEPTEQPAPSFMDRLKSLEAPEVQPVEVPVEATPTETPEPTAPMSFSERVVRLASGEPVPQQEMVNGIPNILPILEEYGDDGLTDEQIMSDPRLMEVVYQDLETRFQPGVTQAGVRALQGVAGGDTGGGILSRNYREMPVEEVFRIWQKGHRSFDVGQTVTTADFLVKATQGSEEDKARIGAGLLLFDAQDRALFKEGGLQATGDYIKGAIWDPSTLLTLGVGRLWTAGGAKASSLATRKLMTSTYKSLVKRGLSKRAAMGIVGGAVNTAKYSAIDLAVNLGVDVGNQLARIEAGVQEDYSVVQGGLTALGTMAVPAIATTIGVGRALRKSGRMQRSFLRYAELNDKIVRDNLDPMKAANKLTNVPGLINGVSQQFGQIQGNPAVIPDWDTIKKTARAGISGRGEKLSDSELMGAFHRFFWFGNDKAGIKGYGETLLDNGFVLHETMLKDNTKTGVYANTIEWLDDSVVEQAMKSFEAAVGQKLNIDYTAKALRDHFAAGASDAGNALNIVSKLPGVDSPAGTASAVRSTLGSVVKADPDAPKRFQWMLSTYKRILTSHLSTTGANLQGFGVLTGLNSMADIGVAAINMTQAGFYKTLGDAGKVEKYYNQAAGAFLGTIRKGVNFLDPNLSMEYVDRVMKLQPEAMDLLFRDISGDGGVRDALSMFNLDKSGNIVYRGVDNITKGAQTIALVRLQDDVTKKIALAGNLDLALMREYGVKDALEFWRRPDLLKEISTKRFQERVMQKALYRTLRETASVNWSQLVNQPGNFARTSAKFFETITNKTPVGFVVPFGSFLNTTVATMSDLTGLNAIRMLNRRVQGKDIDFVTQEGVELIAKAAVGWSALALMVPEARERIVNGLSWNQRDEGDGSIRDYTFDWPYSTLSLMSQMIAHATPEGWNGDPREFDKTKVPEALWLELGLQTGGQAVRDLDDVASDIQRAFRNAQTNESNWELIGDILGPISARIAGGLTRPFDQVNPLVGLFKGNNMNPDLRQGAENYNQAIKYINHILPESMSGVNSLPTRARVTRGTEMTPDLGKIALGVRHSQNPTPIEMMLNSAGRPHWNELRWQGPPEVRNYMDALAAPIFNDEAVRALKANPNFFRMSQSQKEAVLESVNSRTREKVMDIMANSPIPAELEAVRILAGTEKKKLRQVMTFLGISGELGDILQQENGLETLGKIKYLVDNYDNIFNGELSLE